LPNKAAISPAELRAILQRGEPSQQREPVPATGREKPESPKVEDAATTALNAHLERYRALASQLGLPWTGTKSQVCVRFYYGQCYEVRNVMTKAGVRDSLESNFLKGISSPSDRDAMLTAAEQVFAVVAADASGPGDVFALQAPPKRQPASTRGRRVPTEPAPPPVEVKNGPEMFRQLFLAPGKAVRLSLLAIERMTPRDLPVMLRLTFDDVVGGAVAIAREVGATPTERAQAVEAFSKAIVQKEEQRLSDGAQLVEEYQRAVRARDETIRREREAYEAQQELKQARRLLTLYGLGAGASAIISLSLLLALLAIERHLRAMREAAVSASAAGPTEHVETS
jgi:electron transfer flavoprotein alpha subunit